MTDSCKIQAQFLGQMFTAIKGCTKCLKGKDKVWDMVVKRTNFRSGLDEAMFVQIKTNVFDSLDWKNDRFDVPVSI